MHAGSWQPTWSLAEADDEDHKATLKYPAPVVRPPRRSLLRLLPHSTGVGVALAAAFLFLFGDRLVTTATASRAPHVSEQTEVSIPEGPAPTGAPEAVPIPAPAATSAPSTDVEPPLDPCASPRAADWPATLCPWVVARARGEELVPGPSTRDVQAFLFQKGLVRVRGRAVGEPDERGLRQSVVQGVWGYCVVLAAPPAADGSFFAWVRRRAEPASVIVGGREQACVALDEDPVGAVGQLVLTRPGPESVELAKRVLSTL